MQLTGLHFPVISSLMIDSFKCDETQRIDGGRFSRKLPQAIQKVAKRKLNMTQAAVNLNDLRVPPANHLEKLSGNREGQYSIRINDQYRICFVDSATGFAEVEIVDYH